MPATQTTAVTMLEPVVLSCTGF